MPYWRFFYHLIWATKGRAPLIDDAVARVISRSIRSSCEEQRAVLHGLGMMPEHVHIAVSIPPAVAVSAFIGRLKGASSHAVNHATPLIGDNVFAWHAEYGALTFGERNLDDVLAYLRDQPTRHAANRLWLPLECTDDTTQPPSGGLSSSASGLEPRAAGTNRSGPPHTQQINRGIPP